MIGIFGTSRMAARVSSYRSFITSERGSNGRFWPHRTPGPSASPALLGEQRKCAGDCQFDANDPERKQLDSQCCSAKNSFALDVGGLDDGPPFLDFSLLIRAEGLRRLLITWRNLKALVGEF